MVRSCLLLFAVMVVLLTASAVLCAEESEGVSETNWGIGFGVPYGVLGVNVESGAQTRFSAGAGFGLDAGLAWNLGVKHYLQPPSEDRGSASLCVYYGTNAYVDRWGSDDELLQGFSVGLGWTAGHFDIGLLKPIGVDIPSGAEEQGPAIKLYIGYRF